MPSSLSLDAYFSVALPRRLRAQGGAAAAPRANVRFVVTGRGGGTWTLRLRPPAPCVVSGADWKADLVITITAAEMVRMLQGSFDARQALAAGNIELRGDVSVLPQVGVLLRA